MCIVYVCIFFTFVDILNYSCVVIRLSDVESYAKDDNDDDKVDDDVNDAVNIKHNPKTVWNYVNANRKCKDRISD